MNEIGYEETKVGSKACLPTGVQGLGGGLPNLRSKKKGQQKVLKENHVTEALKKLREQTRETVRGLESIVYKPKVGGGGDDLGKEGMMEDWVKQFEELAHIHSIGLEPPQLLDLSPFSSHFILVPEANITHQLLRVTYYHGVITGSRD
ncbi:hypothetical protein IFM89_030341 [Coptis chinensis]|uniref:Uncharacterized protein n=1 Tax=Coptis chinensis TaxID=261450 RepID=A0A835IG78_9MAGN|nr:hypothetical protein IFM89_030341 [Coptis chinensis]